MKATILKRLARVVKKPSFYNRKELDGLNEVLDRGQGALMLLLGQQNSGKTSIVNEFRRQQSSGKYPGVSLYVDLSLRNDPDTDSSNLKQALEEFCTKSPEDGYPTVFLDEAGALQKWDAEDVEELLTFLVRVSKQECAANVVLVSSDAFFKRWLTNQRPMQGQLTETGNVRPLPKDEAEEFLLRHLTRDIKAEVKQVWDDVHGHYGGEISRLIRLKRLLATAEPGTVGSVWEREKTYAIQAAYEQLSPDVFHEKESSEWITAVKMVAKAKDGVVPYSKMAGAVGGLKVDEMVERKVLQLVSCGNVGQDVLEQGMEWPVVMPVSKAHHVAMKKMARTMPFMLTAQEESVLCGGLVVLGLCFIWVWTT